MHSRWVLQEQIDQLQRRLKRVKDALTAPQPGRTAIEDRLLQRVRLQFEARILETSDALAEARRMAADPACELVEAWDVFRPARTQCEPLLAESLAVLEGALARSARLDDGLCDAVDQLVGEISRYALRNWTTFTILYEGELYSTLADVIRIRFPSAGIWDLPIAAHECGHFISRKVWERDSADSSRDAFQDFLIVNQAVPGSRLWRHLNEYFADVFATFAMGPAYPLSTLLLRFDPSKPDAEQETHPSPAKRAHVIIETLEWMDRKSVERPFAGLIEELRSQWKPPDSQACVQLDDYLDQLHPVVDRNFRLARYQTWTQASFLAGRLAEDSPAPGSSVRDMLNAAWLARLRAPEQRDRIAAAVLAWIMQGTAIGPPAQMAHA